jgi:uncharacterized protein YndB with AHSA1/START domain
MNHDLIASGTIDIDAMPSEVWNALTNPEIIKKYLFGTETITDWKVGNSITFQGEYQGQTYRDKGIIQENITEKLLSYKYWSSFYGIEDKIENYSLVTYKLTQTGPVTRLTLINKGFVNEDGLRHSQNGMNEFLKSIKDIIENK